VPTYDWLDEFIREYEALTPGRRAAFKRAVAKFVVDLRTGHFRQGLRIKGVQGQEGVWELTWAPDSRATFRYGYSIRPGDPHVIWPRVGTHYIFE
jgi:hypothetical protein